MSTDTERVEGETESSLSLLETWNQWYHIPIVGVVMLFMFSIRIQAYDRFVTEDGTPALAAIDSWYHWRTVQWTAENYPRTMPYDVWTSFPSGRYVGQFGTLFDQIIVTVAMIVGLGDPSTELLYTIALLSVPAMAALVAIPVFLIGRRLGGTVGGIVSVILLALAPGTFLARTTVGQLQHHVAEVLFMAIAVLAFMVALRVAEREQPIYELVVDKDWDALRTPTIYSALAGIALSLYIWVWPPGVVLIGILAVFFTVQLCLDYVRNVSPDHVAFVGAVSLGLTAVITALLIEEPGTSVTSFGYLQPASAALVALGCVFMAWFARQWNAYDVERVYYPAAIAGLIVAGSAVVWLALPSVFDTFAGNAMRRVVPFGQTATDLTIQEAQPPGNFSEHVFAEFGAAFYTMLAGLAVLIARPFLGREFRTEQTLIVVWSLFLISMAATQIRFAYYLVVAVAVVNAVFIAATLELLDFDIDYLRSVEAIKSVEAYQVIVIVMVVLLLFAPLLPPVAADTDTAWNQSANTGPNPTAQTWEPSNHWLNENTPEPGNWGGADRADELELYGTYEYPEDGNYDYPEGAYGVMSWWDYGHLITVQGERIPHSNPFQSGARSSSAFLTAESEERSELILDAIAAGESPSDHSNEQLESMIADADESDEEIRYVMVDDQMAGNKFPAIATWTGPEYNYYTTPEDLSPNEPVERDEIGETFADVPYYNTTVANLYFGDAIGMEHYRLVHENDERMTTFVSYAVVDAETGELQYNADGNPMVSVNQILDQRTYIQMIQIQQHPDFDIEEFDRRQHTPVKTYERVEGATIEGSVDVENTEDATVTAAVELDTGGERGTFDYVQQGELEDDGSFELTVPYATNDELGVEDGYTNSAVEATEEYRVTVTAPTDDGFDAYDGEVDVPETAVVDGETVEVTLEELEFDDAEEIEDETDVDPEDDSDVDDVDGNESDGTDDGAEDVIDDEATDDGDTAGSFTPVAADVAG
ncbi:oligosaccharyl transferase, archaeosortase A system-associated [Natrarchaeobius chitinivorans]|uniref:dolichyl-phosphooligosaccharide-protein glycotransferase n=1 Tax=Natrarchaeobius chitinivorans TaxID=1679083 RepID=A0A3N6P344_NATCH|nr:oligosaccharyl transferase, archaeosortase A system-associated [Natrarchaeobius chitinivorans]RQG92069.1 oligosaccharyl transferase, archaeosortase A system-associated [Natrarchaeobius chitinivorans]